MQRKRILITVLLWTQLEAMQKEVEKRKKKAKDLAMYKMILGGK